MGYLKLSVALMRLNQTSPVKMVIMSSHVDLICTSCIWTLFLYAFNLLKCSTHLRCMLSIPVSSNIIIVSIEFAQRVYHDDLKSSLLRQWNFPNWGSMLTRVATGSVKRSNANMNDASVSDKTIRLLLCAFVSITSFRNGVSLWSFGSFDLVHFWSSCSFSLRGNDAPRGRLQTIVQACFVAKNGAIFWTANQKCRWKLNECASVFPMTMSWHKRWSVKVFHWMLFLCELVRLPLGEKAMEPHTVLSTHGNTMKAPWNMLISHYIALSHVLIALITLMCSDIVWRFGIIS